jgi:hypothetical protein
MPELPFADRQPAPDALAACHESSSWVGREMEAEAAEAAEAAEVTREAEGVRIQENAWLCEAMPEPWPALHSPLQIVPRIRQALQTSVRFSQDDWASQLSLRAAIRHPWV